MAFRERRPGVLQVLAPLFHEDGDMVDIFLDEPVNGSGKVRIGDHGLTLMRLSYAYDLDTENKQRIFNRILSENRIQEQDGRLYIEAEPERLYPALLQFEQLAEFVEEKLAGYNPRRNMMPIPDHDEYEVDYQFDIGPRPLFLFGVKDNDKARLATISCLEFQRRRIPFKGVMVHQDFESAITKKDRTRITSASDKQFPSLDDFRENGPQFFERERAA